MYMFRVFHEKHQFMLILQRLVLLQAVRFAYTDNLHLGRQQVGLYVGHAAPEVVAGFGVELLESGEHLDHAAAVRGVLVGTVLLLLAIFVQLGKAGDVTLLDTAERTDDGHVKLVHLQGRRHGGESALEGHVHKQGDKHIILMVSEGYLVAPERLGRLEERLAAVPRAEEAGGLSCISRIIKRGLDDVHLYAKSCGKVSEVLRVALVRDIGHHHMGCYDTEARLEHADTRCHEFEQRQRILATRHGDKDAVALFDKTILRRSLVELVAESVHKEFFFGLLGHKTMTKNFVSC